MARESEEQMTASSRSRTPPLRSDGSEAGAAQESAAQLAALVPALRLLAGLLIAALLIAALYFGRPLLIPFALAALLGFLLDPLVRQLCRWGLPRIPSVFLVVLLALGVLTGVAVYVTTQLTELSAELPTYRTTIRNKLHALREVAAKPGAWQGAMTTLETVQKEIDTASAAGRGAPGVQKVEIVGPQSRPTQVVLDWLGRVSEPVATTGIALLFVILILLDRRDLRDRLLRLAGGDLHAATDAMDEAAARVGRYLRMQFLINASFAVPMGVGLWLIGVPAAALWGFVAAVMRFVPYVGPIVSAAFPILLAFAVSPDWSMVLWTIGLILALELVCSNFIEPWLYGSSTGLSAMSVIVAAMFWTTLWGPIGLILSTPLTVCLVVIGRYLPSLRFLEVLLGNEEALAPPQRLYQRLLARDIEEAMDLAHDFVEDRRDPKSGDEGTARALAAFYDEVAVPMLRIATSHHVDVATAEHRLRLATGLAELIADLREDYPPASLHEKTTGNVLCVGARWEADILAAEMAAHALQLQGYAASAANQALLSPLGQDLLPALAQAELVCVSMFAPRPLARARLAVRRLRQRTPQAGIVVAAWNATDASGDVARDLGIDAFVADLGDVLLHVGHLLRTGEATGALQQAPDAEREAARVRALHASGALGDGQVALYAETIRRAANAFDVKYAEISWVDAERAYVPASPLGSPAGGIPRELSVGALVVDADSPIVLADVARDPRLAANPRLCDHDVHFCAGTPLRDRDRRPLGALCILDPEPRTMSEAETALLAEMADELMQRILDDA